MRYIIIFSLFFLGCTPNYNNGTIRSKTQVVDKDSLCKYDILQVVSPWNSKFYAPCDCYDVGDSLNKWYRLGKQVVDSASEKKKNR